LPQPLPAPPPFARFGLWPFVGMVGLAGIVVLGAEGRARPVA
jgi:hypothetical protein